jgi:hypothetical protein
MLTTRSIKARARQKGRASLYDWIVYERGSKAKEKEKKGKDKQHLKSYTIFGSRDRIC